MKNGHDLDGRRVLRESNKTKLILGVPKSVTLSILAVMTVLFSLVFLAFASSILWPLGKLVFYGEYSSNTTTSIILIAPFCFACVYGFQKFRAYLYTQNKHDFFTHEIVLDKDNNRISRKEETIGLLSEISQLFITRKRRSSGTFDYQLICQLGKGESFLIDSGLDKLRIEKLAYHIIKFIKLHHVSDEFTYVDKEIIPIGESSSFKTKVLTISGKQNVKIKPSWRSFLFVFFVLALTSGIFIFLTISHIPVWAQPLFTTMVIISFSYLIFKGLTQHFKVQKFQLEKKQFYEYFLIDVPIMRFNGFESLDLNLVDHIQFIDKSNTDSEGDEFKSYEVNLVLDSSKRINLMDSGDFNEADYTLRTLSSKLKKPSKYLSWPQDNSIV